MDDRPVHGFYSPQHESAPKSVRSKLPRMITPAKQLSKNLANKLTPSRSKPDVRQANAQDEPSPNKRHSFGAMFNGPVIRKMEQCFSDADLKRRAQRLGDSVADEISHIKETKLNAVKFTRFR